MVKRKKKKKRKELTSKFGRSSVECYTDVHGCGVATNKTKPYHWPDFQHMVELWQTFCNHWIDCSVVDRCHESVKIAPTKIIVTFSKA